MRPLSVFSYNRNNKMKFLTSIIPVAVAVSFLYILITFAKGAQLSIYRTILNFRNYSLCLPYLKERGISEGLVVKIKSDRNVEKIIPIRKYGIQYDIPYENAVTKLLAVKNEDMDYFLGKSHDKIIQGRLPEDGKNEIAVHYYEAKNQNIKLNDIVGGKQCKLTDIKGEYKVVGILGGENLVSVLSANNESMPNYENTGKAALNGFIAFPKNGRIDEMNKFLEKLPGRQITVETLNNLNDEFNKFKEGSGIINILIIGSIFLMVVTVGSSRYVQFFNRKEELGILNAIGYSKKKILKRALIEIFQINAVSYLLGIAMGTYTSFLIKKYVLETSGSIGIIFDLGAFIISLYIPLFTALFTVIPINLMINKLDPISMIEEN